MGERLSAATGDRSAARGGALSPLTSTIVPIWFFAHPP